MGETKIEEKIHEVYIHNEYKTGGSDVRLVVWWVNDKPFPVRFERRDYFIKGEEEQKTNGKAKGLNIADMKFVRDNIGSIIERMEQINEENKSVKQKQKEYHDDDEDAAVSSSGWRDDG